MNPAAIFHSFPGGAGTATPYSPAVEIDGWVFLAGQVPNDPPNDATPLPPDIEGQTRLAMDNLLAALRPLGLDLSDLVAVKIFLTRFEEEFARMNATYRSFFPSDRLPARTCVGVTALVGGGRIEIDGIARRR